MSVEELRAIAQAATPGPWERGDVWQRAGTGFIGKDNNTCTYCERSGEPVWVGRADVNGKMMKTHIHRNPAPYEPDHLVSSQDGLVTGNYDYEAGGIIDPVDTVHIATFDPVLVAAMLDVIDAAVDVGDSHRPHNDACACADCDLWDALARFREVAP